MYLIAGLCKVQKEWLRSLYPKLHFWCFFPCFDFSPVPDRLKSFTWRHPGVRCRVSPALIHCRDGRVETKSFQVTNTSDHWTAKLFILYMTYMTHWLPSNFIAFSISTKTVSFLWVTSIAGHRLLSIFKWFRLKKVIFFHPVLALPSFPNSRI